MNSIRFIGAFALAGMLAGCAGKTALDQGGSMPLQKDRQAAREAPAQKTAALPTAPGTAIPTAPRVIPTAPLTRPAPVAVVELPRVVEPVPAPVYIAEAGAAPVAVVELDPSRYRPVGDLDAPTPVSVPEPVYVMTERVDPLPAPTLRAMAPIRDDPQDGRSTRRAANDEVRQHARKGYRRNAALRAGGRKPKIRSNFTPAFGMKLERAALERLNPSVRYDARYVKISYPWGDVDETTGVCTDVVIRSYRKLGIDLQEMVHEDMKRAFDAYPSRRIYGLKSADANIDHRRVVNLEAFFERTGASVPVGSEPDDFKAGDVLTWRLSGNEPHIGIVVADRDPRTGYPLVVHNLGAGVRKDDLITLSDPVGHFRFAPDRQTVVAALVTKR